MNDLRIFENPEFGKIRTVIIKGEPWFVGKDVARALGYGSSNHKSKALSNAIKAHVDEEDKILLSYEEFKGYQNGDLKNISHYGATVINESGMYALIFGSKLPSAKRFKHWVTSEVLPSIRKTGSYGGQMEKLMEITEQLTQAAEMIVQATSSITQSINHLVSVVDRLSNEKAVESQISKIGSESGIEAKYYCPGRCKLETFPKEIVDQVNEMLETMIQQQNLNFSMIVRFCAVNGYCISGPSVKTYFQKHFADD